MSDQEMTTVDLPFNDKWEGLDYHRFFWGQCHHVVMLQSMHVESGIFGFPGHFMLEYHGARVETESWFAYNMIQIWMYNRNPRFLIRYHFANKAEAALFKLTFGGT